MPEAILIIDDDAAILEGMRLILEDEGYVVTVGAVPPPVEEIVALRPAMIILDIWMSGRDGRDVCRALKANPWTRDIPIALASANADTPRLAAEAGADAALLKPFDIDDLLQIVTQLTRRAQV